MPLTQAQVERLHNAIDGYAFPAVYFDFNDNLEVDAQNIVELEEIIAAQLRSQEVNVVKHGLANVLYWGFAQIGYRENRVNDFMDKVTSRQIENFQALIYENRTPTLMEIKDVRMPQYSGISFVSKILMFLNPNSYCVLDKQLAYLRTPGSPKILNESAFGGRETQIRITSHNETIYNGWRNECSTINQMYFDGGYRVVDVERGFFNLIQNDDLLDAQVLYNEA